MVHERLKMMKNGHFNWLSPGHCFIETYQGHLCSVNVLFKFKRLRFNFPASGGGFLLTSNKSTPQVADNYLDHTTGYAMVFIIMKISKTNSQTWVVYGSNKCVNYSAKKQTMVKMMKMWLKTIRRGSLILFMATYSMQV